MTLAPIPKEKRLETLSVLAGFCFLVAWIKLHHGSSAPSVRVWIEAGLALLTIGLFIGPIATVIAQLWLKLSHGIGAVMSRLLITLVFFLVLLPISLLRRIVTRDDSLLLKRKVDGASYYTGEARTYTARDLQHPW